MKITVYNGLKRCCDCGATGQYTVETAGYKLTVCRNCVDNYREEVEADAEDADYCGDEYSEGLEW